VDSGEGRLAGHGAAESAGLSAGSPARLVLDACDRNLASYLEFLASTSAGGRVERGDGYLCFAGAHEYPGTYTNGVIRTDEASGGRTPAELLARADAFFGSLGRSYVAWVRTHRDADLDRELQRRGVFVRPPAEGSEAVVMERHEFEPGPTPDGVRVAEADDDDQLREFLLLVASCYSMPEAELGLAEGVLFSVESLRHPDNHVYVARDLETGALLGGVTVYVSGQVGYLAWAVTDPLARGRGIGRFLFRHAAREAFAADASIAWGVASQVGAPIWRSIGFETVSRYKRYVVPAPDAVGGPASSPARRPRRGARLQVSP